MAWCEWLAELGVRVVGGIWSGLKIVVGFIKAWRFG